MSYRDKEATLTLTFENDGKTVHKETSGFTGKDCEKITDFIEKALNASNEERTHTREYYEDDNRREPRLRV
jgi:hypothetical protein